MKTTWFKHLKTEEEKDKFKNSVKASYDVLERLQEILGDKIEVKLNTSDSDYNQASWAYQQADANGYVRALREVTSLLTLGEE